MTKNPRYPNAILRKLNLKDRRRVVEISKMATSLASRAASIEKSWRPSLNFIRNLSTSAPTPSTPAAAAATKPKRKKKKNLFEVAQFLPEWGLGYQMAKTHWVGVSYQITKINLYKDGKHGKAWGIVHKDGLPAADAPKKISGVHKRCWRYIPNSMKTEQSPPKTDIQKESTPTSEILAA